MSLNPAQIQVANRNTQNTFDRITRLKNAGNATDSRGDPGFGFTFKKSVNAAGLVTINVIKPNRFIINPDDAGDRSLNQDFTSFNQNLGVFKAQQGLTSASSPFSLRSIISDEVDTSGRFGSFFNSVKKAAQETTKNTLRPSKLKENARQTKDIARPLARELGKIAIASTALYYAAPILASATSGAGVSATASAGSTTTALASTNIGGGLVSSALAGEGFIVGAGTVLAPSAIGAGTVLAASTGAAVTVTSLAGTSTAVVTTGGATAGIGALGSVIDKGKDIVAAEAVNKLGQVLVKNPNAEGIINFPGTRIVGTIEDDPGVAPTIILILAGIVGVFAMFRS